jgi:hypothetical protein
MERLRRAFPGRRGVHLKGLHEDKEGAENWFSYSADSRINAPKRAPLNKPLDPHEIIRVVNLFGEIAESGFSRTCRIKVGVRKVSLVENDPIVKEWLDEWEKNMRDSIHYDYSALANEEPDTDPDWRHPTDKAISMGEFDLSDAEIACPSEDA